MNSPGLSMVTLSQARAGVLVRLLNIRFLIRVKLLFGRRVGPLVSIRRVKLVSGWCNVSKLQLA